MNAEQRAIRQSAKDFAAAHIIPRAAEYDKSGEFHRYLLDAARPGGIFAMAVPTAYGGLGYGPMTQALVLEQWGYGCAAMGTTLSASIMSMEAVMIAGTDEQKRRFFRPMLTAGVGAFALTEPASGSDIGAVQATAVKGEEGYVLNGAKCWVTNGAKAELLVVFAITDPAKGMKGLSAFIVAHDQPGFIPGDSDAKLGLRSANTMLFSMQNMRVLASNLIGVEGDGMCLALQTLDVGSAGALAVGLAQRCLDECVRHIQARYPAHFAPGQTLQFRLADMRIQIEGARQALHRVMALREARLPFSEEAAIAKTLCTDVAMAVTSRAMRLIGSYAYASEFGKFMRDAKVMQISEGTNQIQRLAIARGLLAPPGAAAAP